MRVTLAPRFATAALELSGVDFNVDTDQAYFDIPFKCQAVYAGATITVVAGASDTNLRFDRRNAATSDTGRTDGTIANIIIPNATAIGTMVYDKACQTSLTETAAALLITKDTCNAGGGVWDATNSKCNNAPYGQLEPGNEVVVQTIAGSGTGNAQPILVVDVDEDVFANLKNVLETA